MWPSTSGRPRIIIPVLRAAPARRRLLFGVAAGLGIGALLTGCASLVIPEGYTGPAEYNGGGQTAPAPEIGLGSVPEHELTISPETGLPAAPPQVLPDSAGFGIWDVPLEQLAAPDWLARTSEATGIPERALSAYAGAAIRVSETRPECGIGWNTLAGIGAVESRHGTYGGSQVSVTGLVEPPIIGVPLNGSDGFLAIPDTDGGALDGDTEWDRAVGPMQFIPETWAKYGQDANFDGVADPHQIDDAVQTAAVYLCERGGDLTSDDGWATAIAAYNLPAAYARDVAGHAEYFAQ